LDRAALQAAPRSEWQSILENQLRDQTARVLKLAPHALDVDQPLSNVGIDSLMAIELKNRIEADLGATVPMVKFLEGPSVRDLAAFLADQLVVVLARVRREVPGRRNGREAPRVHGPTNGSSEQAADDAAHVDAGQLLARLDTLSDEEVDSLLQGLCDAEKGD
jgi:acyl carrier protein